MKPGRTDRRGGFPGIARRRPGHRHDAVCRSRLVGLLSARRSAKMRFATDTGGTFTDLIIEDDDGRISDVQGGDRSDRAGQRRARRFRRLPPRNSGSTVARCSGAATSSSTAPRTRSTRSSPRRTARTAFWSPAAIPTSWCCAKAGGSEPFNHTVPYPEPYVPRSLTFEVPERILAAGEIRTPLDEDAVAAIADRLRGSAVEAVAVCLLWSIVNPAHELRVGAMLAEHLAGRSGHAVASAQPALREYRRAIVRRASTPRSSR